MFETIVNCESHLNASTAHLSQQWLYYILSSICWNCCVNKLLLMSVLSVAF